MRFDGLAVLDEGRHIEWLDLSLIITWIADGQ